MRVYVLIEEWGEYTDYTKTIGGVFSSAVLAMASKPYVSWTAEMIGVSHSRAHQDYESPQFCSQCRSDWSIEEFIVDAE